MAVVVFLVVDLVVEVAAVGKAEKISMEPGNLLVKKENYEF